MATCPPCSRWCVDPVNARLGVHTAPRLPVYRELLSEERRVKMAPANKKRDLRGEKKKAGDKSRGGNSSRVPKSKRRERSVGEEENGKGAAGDAEGICETL